MNFQKIAFTFLVCLLFLKVEAQKQKLEEFDNVWKRVFDTATKEEVLDRENAILQFLAGEAFFHKPKEELLNAVHPEKVYGLALLATGFGLDERTQRFVCQSLRYVYYKKPELLQQAADLYIVQGAVDARIIKIFSAAGVKFDEKLEGQEVTLKDKLAAHEKSHNCNGTWSKIFGKSRECKALGESLSCLEK